MKGHLAVGIFTLVATLAGSHGAMFIGMGERHSARSVDQVSLDVLKLEPVSVPIVRAGAIAGYAIARVSLSVPVPELKTMRPILAAYATEAVFRSVYEETVFDFSGLKVVEIKALTDRITKFSNERIGRDVVKGAVIDGLSFVEPTGIRSRGG